MVKGRAVISQKKLIGVVGGLQVRSGRTPGFRSIEPVAFERNSNSDSGTFRAVLQNHAGGVTEVAASDCVLVCIHVGRSVSIQSRHGHKRHSSVVVHGDLEIIPAGVAVRWETTEPVTSLVLSIPPNLLRKVIADSGLEGARVELHDRFHIRDPHIERIGWALMEEVDQGYPSGRLYLDSMATAIAVQLLRSHSSVSGKHALPSGGLSRGKLHVVLSFIEDNLNGELPLRSIAKVAGISVSHLKALFRKSVGVSVHQYVIRRRVERATVLLRHSSMPISQIALETGFSHQSHLAMHMRRVMGVAPKDIAKMPEIA